MLYVIGVSFNAKTMYILVKQSFSYKVAYCSITILTISPASKVVFGCRVNMIF